MAELLDLQGKGWQNPQRDYDLEPDWQVAEDERELGNVTSVAVAVKERRRVTMRYRTDTRDAAEYVESFFRRKVGPVARFDVLWPEFVASPDAAPVVEAVVAGTQGSRTIYTKFCWVNSYGRTKASPAVSIAVPSNSLLKVTLPYYPPSVTQAVIFATQGSPGSEQEQTILTNQKTWQQPDAALLTSTTSVPSTNSAQELVHCKLGQGRYKLRRGAGTTYELTIDLEETYS